MLTAIGMMSGTSMDGIDVAILKSDGEARLERGPSAFFPYEENFRRRIAAGLEAAKGLKDRDARPGGLDVLERELTLLHVGAARDFLRSLPASFLPVDLIGFHGQTVLHRPEQGLTVQLGDGALLARELGVGVVYDMRARDMAEGGQGAPLVPAYHASLARGLLGNGLRFPVAFVNIGGISNITLVPQEGDPIAFDTGPGNMLIDQFVAAYTDQSFDEDGRIGAGGRIIENVAQSYLGDPFFGRRPPKSLDRADFSLAAAIGLPLADGARTLAAVTARSIFRAREQLDAAPASWVICGGGRRNPNILAELRLLVAAGGAEILTADQLGLNGDAVEAEAWAYLAIRSRKGLALTYPTTTGCREAVSGGIWVSAQDDNIMR